MRARHDHQIDSIRASVERTKTISDKIVGIGPFSLGLDGVLGWIPLVGAAYSVGAGGFLLVQALRARASPTTVAKMVVLLTADALTDMVPVAGSIADMVFTGHKWAADALMKGMDETVYYPGHRHEAEADPVFQALTVRMRSGQDPRRRVVYLGRS